MNAGGSGLFHVKHETSNLEDAWKEFKIRRKEIKTGRNKIKVRRNEIQISLPSMNQPFQWLIADFDRERPGKSGATPTRRRENRQ